MSCQKIFFNLPVVDVKKAIAFWTELGFAFHPQFTDDSAACLVFSEAIHAMLLSQAKFKEYSPKPMSDAKKEAGVLIAIACDSRDEVTQIVNRAVALGGKRHEEPQDYGFMYQDSFEDPEGHCWAFMHMTPPSV